MNNKDVPYIVYESESARHERTVKRLLFTIVLVVCLKEAQICINYIT